MAKMKLIKDVDYYINESGKFVFTEKFHLDRGFCCKSINGCKHCPYPEEERRHRALP